MLRTYTGTLEPGQLKAATKNSFLPLFSPAGNTSQKARQTQYYPGHQEMGWPSCHWVPALQIPVVKMLFTWGAHPREPLKACPAAKAAQKD